MNMIDETACIQKVKVGDTDAYRFLVERYQTGLIIHCENIVKDRSDGEDISQEAFIKAFNSIESFSSDTSRFSTWLYRIATNLCIDHLRKYKRQVHIKNLEEHIASVEPDHFKEEDISRIRTAIETLEPPKYADIIQAYFWEGKSYQEIARTYATSTNTIGTWMRRAKLQLKEKLA
jgi:RNA polymerase sigma-70 factor (ECF subfamily)